MILRTVARRALPAHRFKQFLFKHGEMADVVDRHQVFGRVVGLEMPDLGALGGFFKQGFVAVHKVRAGFCQQPARAVDSVGGQHIVVIRQRKVAAGRQLGGGVGVGGDALVFDFGVDNARLGGGVFPHDVRDLGVVGIAGIRQHQLPVGRGLPDDAFDIGTQKIFRRVVQRRQDADGGELLCRCVLPLGLQSFFAGQIARLFAQEPALTKARRTRYHGTHALLPRKGAGVAEQFLDSFGFLTHSSSS